ncbi:L-cysteine desulfidase family protein [Aminicella lysinilytica]|uniref:UPF0597 protein EV211_1403 n=1 Tax=Aminicella lysinilytica TaxID=433323 RepID=A0A4R6PZB2_9FIRM|nr:L-serine ammonia-lyase, iron-sulfur-dependent, subunit alpha [Aminicella lysinilytica]TDP50321.1 L-cysteine desulfidase [Aminicella lysinilytica]
MKITDEKYRIYLDILNKELLTAMGCTEPIAVAFCAAKARQIPGSMPDRVLAQVSGNIIKNVKSVIVPNTDGAKGIETAVAIGIAGGDPGKELEVISSVTLAQKEQMREFLSRRVIKVEPLDSRYPLDIKITVFSGDESAMVHIVNDHTNIVEIEKNSETVEHHDIEDVSKDEYEEYMQLSIEDIYDFADTCDIGDVCELLNRQIECNEAISREGMSGDYGANVGSVIDAEYGQDIRGKARALAAAGSDARMNGCELPVVINSGSGNQGLTVSIPLIVYARELGSPAEKLYRALLISNLSAIHLKTEIGRLSAYCGAVSAGASVGAGIAYLKGGDLDTISHTIVNALAITSGIICDGAKASCAAKIAVSVEAGIVGYEMYQRGQQFYGGDGIVSKGIENTIRNIGRLGSKGMFETDKEIIRIMCD